MFGLGQLGNRVHGRNFHLIGDGGGAAVQCPTEDVGEAQDVVHLVRIVRTARGHDDVVAHAVRELGRDLGVGVRQREDHRALGHGGHHLGLEHVAGRQAQEHVRPHHHLGQLARVGLLHELALVVVHQLFAAFVDHTGQIGDEHVLALHAHLEQQVQAGQGRRARAAGDQLHVFNLLACHLQRIHDGRRHRDGRAMLIVVEDRDLHALAQLAFHVEAIGSLDVFEVDGAKGGLQRCDHLHQLGGVLFVDLDVEHIDARKLLEQDGLAFHHRLGGQRADVAQAQHGGAVGNHGHQVAARRVAEGVGRVLHDLFARGSHTGRVGQREIVLVDHLLGRGNRQLTRLGKLVVLESGTAQLGTLVGIVVVVLGRGVLGHSVSPTQGVRGQNRTPAESAAGGQLCKGL